MVEVSGGLDLAQEALRAKHRGELGPQDLHSDLAVVLEVFGQVHRRHPARTDLFLDGIAVG